MNKSRSLPALTGSRTQRKPPRPPSKNKKRESSAWRVLEGISKLFELGSMFKSERQLVESAQRSLVLAETLDVNQATYDPLTTDPDQVKFIKEHAPRVHYKRRLEYYRIAEPELRPPKPMEPELEDELVLNEKLKEAQRLGIANDVIRSKMKANQLNEHQKQRIRRQEVKEQEMVRRQKAIAEEESKARKEMARKRKLAREEAAAEARDKAETSPANADTIYS